jgi:protein CpxP
MTKKRIIGGAVALAAALMMTVAAFAQHGPGGFGGHHGSGGPGQHGGPGGRGGLLGRFSQVLDLTDAQKTQIKQIDESFRESTKSLHEQLKGSGVPFETLTDGAFDEAAVRAAAQSRANVHVELEVAHARMLSQVFAVLTAEQKAKLTEIHRQMQERHRQPSPAPGAGDGGR